MTDFALHPSGSPLFVSGSQGVRALDINSGSLLTVPMPYGTNALKALAISPDGRLLVGAKARGGFHFWRAGWKEWLAEGCDRLQRHELFTVMAKPGLTVETIPGWVGVEPYYALHACRRHVWDKK